MERRVLLCCVCVQVDGEEDVKAGLGLDEFSEVLVQLGAWQAVVSLGGCLSIPGGCSYTFVSKYSRLFFVSMVTLCIGITRTIPAWILVTHLWHLS